MAQKTETKTEAKATKAPAFIVWFAPDRENAPWVRMGAMWPIKDGKGFRQALDMVPVGRGNIIALPYEPKANQAGAGA